MDNISRTLDEEWVDLFSNKSFIQNLRPDSLSNILLGQRFPKEMFLSLIHEATHHWCFSSQLGNTLFYIKTRAYSTFLQNARTQNTERAKWDIYSDYTRYYTVKRLYDPLAEGLALFAEYDVYSTKTEAIPTYLVFLSIVFSGFSVGEYTSQSLKSFEEAYNAFLYERRILSRNGQNRKAELLIKPASISRSPYLTGYLFVKTMQVLLMTQVDVKFKDPNIFLQFVKAYYYEDPAFVKMIFDDDISAGDIVPEYLKYFNRRTAELSHLPADTVERFTKAITNPNPYDLYTIISDPDIALAIRQEVENRITGLFQVFGAAFYIGLMRNYLRITRLNCYVKVSASKILVQVRVPYSGDVEVKLKTMLEVGAAVRRGGFLDVLAYSMPNLEEHADFEGEAYFEKYIFLGPQPKTFEVLLTGEVPIFLVTLTGISKIPLDERAYIHDYFHKVLPVLPTFESDAVLKSLWSHDPDIARIETFHEERNFGQIEKYYEEAALGCTDTMLEQVRALMAEDGFWRILDEREDLVDLLSLLSLITSLINSGDFPPLKELQELIAEEHSEENIRELAEKLECFGFRTLIPTEWITMTMRV